MMFYMEATNNTSNSETVPMPEIWAGLKFDKDGFRVGFNEDDRYWEDRRNGLHLD